MFHVVEKNETNLFCSMYFFPRESCSLGDNVEKYVRIRHDAGDIIRRMRFECWVTEVTDTHSRILQHLLLFHYKSRYTNSLHCYVTHTISVLFLLIWLSCPAVCWSPFYGKLHHAVIVSSLWMCQIWSNVKLSLVPTNYALQHFMFCWLYILV